MIGEFASNEDKNDPDNSESRIINYIDNKERDKSRKAVWVKEAFDKIKNDYKRIKIFTWFNIDKEADWRVDSSNETLKAFRSAISDTYYKEKI